MQQHELDRRHIPRRAVVETYFVEGVALWAGSVVGEVVQHRDLVGRAVDLDDQVAAVSAQRHIAGQHACHELQHVLLAHGRVGCAAVGVACIGQGVLPVAPAEQVGVAAVPADERVVARTTVEDVVAAHTAVVAVSVQAVVAGTPPKRIVTVLPEQRVIAGATVDQIAPCAAAEGVGSGIAEVDVARVRTAANRTLQHMQRIQLRLQRRVGGDTLHPSAQLSHAVEPHCRQGGCGVAVDLDQVDQRVALVNELFALELGGQRCGVKVNPGAVDGKGDRIQIGVKPGLHDHGTVDRFTQGVIGRIDGRDLLG